MSDIERTRADTIIILHNEIIGHLTKSLEKAIRIGELLTEQKRTLKHGDFTNWILDNLPFTDRTARNYMRLYDNRDKLKTENVSDLASAYKLLSYNPTIKEPSSYAEGDLRKSLDDAIALSHDQNFILSPSEKEDLIICKIVRDILGDLPGTLTPVGWIPPNESMTKEQWEEGLCRLLALNKILNLRCTSRPGKHRKYDFTDNIS